MPEPANTALLPAGLHDVLPPDAAHEAAAVERLMAEFAGHGYERVKPPLVEFEESLLAASGAAMTQQTFRLMDPLSQKTMAVRADITPQVARIATSRLTKAPRPLRLCYAGQVLRVKGTQLRHERQFAQAGVELIGALEPEADAEVVLLAARALEVVGVRRPTVDLCVPTMVPLICRALGISDEDTATLRAALDRKDIAAVTAVGGPAAPLLERLIAASGPAERAMRALEALELPDAAEKDRRRLRAVMALLRAAQPDLTVTIDLVEYRGFEYHSGLSFTLFARGVRGELGAGGRYRTGTGGEDAGEPATGFTLFMDTVLRAVPMTPPPRRLFLPHGTPTDVAARLRGEGWVTVAGLAHADDEAAEARRLRCGHRLAGGATHAVS
ncbi:ATP phosphoribosyltransferase regulatory subunit [Azospirillum sp. RWY-5-1]|uniref:ATP phosphoribosyltransferase regulatory subunit n=1 Tax=Azospirillum oleiclasticum TaxID=2735135 RepID=A0ABX2TKS2_9PROT|nr:ATP phosphoribosyltransferase regulatory subunit [Azospirillum oleiclasticum]NYZ16280.1 ATP phosphoribosyltransferase regulatory subunit [Azospirillum oleiclasticum]NYZ23767.1 ATP phosphoribosyltransferase regulatory subunit [Azospirillum oleiclasticum]